MSVLTQFYLSTNSVLTQCYHRVVNAVLTSLDALKRFRNVLVLCTSNMIEGIDDAFRDRIDLCVYLGLPNCQARYQILHSCVVELMEKGLIYPAVPLRDFVDLGISTFESATSRATPGDDNKSTNSCENHLSEDSTHEIRNRDISSFKKLKSEELESAEQLLYRISLLAEGTSGRSLRKLPLKAHAYFIQRPSVGVMEFLSAMEQTLALQT